MQECDLCYKEMMQGTAVFTIDGLDDFDKAFCSKECMIKWSEENLTYTKHRLLSAGHYAQEQEGLKLAEARTTPSKDG